MKRARTSQDNIEEAPHSVEDKTISSDDDVPLLSRSPSPPTQPMDVDDIARYDEYLNKPVQDVVTVETRIKSSNKGFGLLAKLGWKEGQPLGLSSDGRVDPIPFALKRDVTGLGKASQDFKMIEETVSQRRGLDSERQRFETAEQRREREATAAQRTAIQEKITETLRPFYCSLCDKQFQNVAQYDEHTNSYAHAHRARYKDLQASAKVTQESTDERKEREKKREEKELRKLAKAAGVKLTKAAASSVPAPIPDPLAVASVGAPPIGKGSGWVAISATPAFRSVVPANTTFVSETQSAATLVNSAGGFRTGGWTSFDAADVPTRVAAAHGPPDFSQHASPSQPSSSSVASYSNDRHEAAQEGRMVPQPLIESAPSVPSNQGPEMENSNACAQRPSATSTISAKSALPKAANTRKKAEESRGNWQSFKKGGGKKF